MRIMHHYVNASISLWTCNKKSDTLTHKYKKAVFEVHFLLDYLPFSGRCRNWDPEADSVRTFSDSTENRYVCDKKVKRDC